MIFVYNIKVFHFFYNIKNKNKIKAKKVLQLLINLLQFKSQTNYLSIKFLTNILTLN